MSLVAEYVQWLSWTLLSASSIYLKNPTFDTVFPTEDMLEQHFSSALVTFAPRLLDIMQSASPPSIDYFKSLPSASLPLWGVYLLVFEKTGSRPKIYIGSGTCQDQGLKRRLRNYDLETIISRNVRQALDDGFVIVHQGLLCSAPIPTAALRFPIRTLILLLEAVFCIVLWAMASRTKDYGMPTLCPWDCDTLAYDGLCSHTRSLESVSGADRNLTPEELEAEETIRLEKAADQTARRYYDFKKNDFLAWQATRRGYDAKRDHTEKLESMYKSKAKAKAEWRFACNICNLPFETATS
jgi:hypothetical protein